MTQPCSSTSARSNGTTSFSTASTSSIVPGSVSNRSLCCISTPIWALLQPGDERGRAGGAATGRKLEKPVCHYSLSWAKDEKPERQEMRRAAKESLKALGMERHQALVVSHRERATARARDREPGGPGEREGGGVEPEQAETFEVGRGVRAGALQVLAEISCSRWT